ncbi:MAG: hypothetical protein CMO81_12355 [Waddliaceae bacterium]|nr:hypothetical protein [Waddliaceae bacterium]
MNTVLLLSWGMIVLSGACGFWRLWSGPNTRNRILAFDYLCCTIVAAMVLHSFERISHLYLELIMIFSLLGFATVIAFMEGFFSKTQEAED